MLSDFTCDRCGLSPASLSDSAWQCPTAPLIGVQSSKRCQMILFKMLNELFLALWQGAVLFLPGSKPRTTFVTLLASTLIPLHWAGLRREMIVMQNLKFGTVRLKNVFGCSDNSKRARKSFGEYNEHLPERYCNGGNTVIFWIMWYFFPPL